MRAIRPLHRSRDRSPEVVVLLFFLHQVDQEYTNDHPLREKQQPDVLDTHKSVLQRDDIYQRLFRNVLFSAHQGHREMLFYQKMKSACC